MNCWTIFKDSATLLITAATAFFAVRTFQTNARTRRADVLSNLHKSFFVEASYKDMRSKLDDDSDGGEQKRQRLVQDEEPEFTDFLNYFEFVAYLWYSKNLSLSDVDALLGYYLSLLCKSASIRKYIRDEKHGFEHLNHLLDTVAR